MRTWSYRAGRLLLGLVAAALAIRRLPSLILGLASAWLSHRLSPGQDPYTSIFIGALVTFVLGLIMGRAAEVIVVLASLALADWIGIWIGKISQRLALSTCLAEAA